MPKYSGESVKATLNNLSSSRGSYISKGLGRVFRDKISHPVFGTQGVGAALKKPTIDKKTLIEIYRKAKEAKGVLRDISGTKSENEFIKQVTKQQRVDQIEQKNQQNTKSDTNKTALENQKKIQAKNKQPEIVKPKDEKDSNIYLSRKRSLEAGRGREIGSISKLDQVREAQSKFRETYGKSSEIGVKSRGAPTEGGLIGHAVKEEEKSDSSNKSGQKKGGNAPVGQKSGGHQPVKLQGSAGIDQLTHRQEVAKGENLPGGVYHVKELEMVSQPETPPAPRSASDTNDITDLDIG